MKLKDKYYYIAVDFDGTLVTNKFPAIGDKRPEVFELVEKYKSLAEGVGLIPIVILWTCRCNREEGQFLDEAVTWCKDNGFHLDYVNENPLSPFSDYQRKLHFDITLDDRAVGV